MLALGAALAGLAAQGGRWSNALDGLTHLAVIWLAGGLVAIVLWFVAGGRGKGAPILAGLAIVCAGLLMAPELVSTARPTVVAPRSETLKIIQFNVYAWNLKEPETVAWIKAQNADVIIAEEAVHGGDEVIQALAKDYAYHTECMGRDWCDVVILSRKPVSQTAKAIDLEIGNGGIAYAQFDGEKGPYTIMGVHYVWPDPASPQWINRAVMRRNIEHFDRDSLILTGDFNSTPWSFALRRQDEHLGLRRLTWAMPTFPAHFGSLPAVPFLPLDHVYAGKDWHLVSLVRGPRLGSDHYPIVFTLTR